MSRTARAELLVFQLIWPLVGVVMWPALGLAAPRTAVEGAVGGVGVSTPAAVPLLPTAPATDLPSGTPVEVLPRTPAAMRVPVLLVDEVTEAEFSPEQNAELEAALARGLARTGTLELLAAPPELRGIDPQRCLRQDCLRLTAQRPAGFLLSFRMSARDKDYSFRLAFVDAADPTSRKDLVGTCDICSFDEACRSLEELIALANLPVPVTRLGPIPNAGALAHPVPLQAPTRPAPVVPEPVSEAPPPRVAPEPVNPAPASPSATSLPPWPPGWTLWGGSVGHTSFAVGTGMLAAGASALLIGLAAYPQLAAQSGKNVALLFDVSGGGAMLFGLYLLFRGDAPPPGAQRLAPAPPTSAAGSTARLSPLLFHHAGQWGLGLAGTY